MASRSYNNGRDKREAQGESVPPAGGEDYRDAAIIRIQAEMEEMRQVLMANKLKKPIHNASELSSESNRGEGDLGEKLVTKIAATSRSILSTRLKARILRSTQMDNSCQGHLKEFVDQEKRKEEEPEVILNPRSSTPTNIPWSSSCGSAITTSNKSWWTPTVQLRMKGVTSTLHHVIKFSTPKGEEMLCGDQIVVKQCYLDTTKKVDDLIRYELDEPTSDRFFLVGSNMKERERTELIEFLKANIEVFAWTLYEMPGIDPNFIRHELNVMPKARPVKQRGRRLAAKHVNAVIKEVKKLKEAKAITERMITKMFGPFMESTMDVYIDDIVVKIEEEQDHLRDFAEVFEILKEHKLILNADK
ncbi:hypothetical protein Acr_24g0007970 [Actinidia rufa]|uniref:Reverse transcriptase domain-containing protein n=1 Tax=Actinidia rufa TaxID=165716 RepID=A0A7J0GUT8_9ERIC|nr:hypothetical protein Acr_24g0007970 [Actinidia rufa]